jgi:hypothetical protein
MPVRRSSTSFRQLLRGSSYFSRLPTKRSSSNKYAFNARTRESALASFVSETLRSMRRRAARPIASSRAR